MSIASARVRAKRVRNYIMKGDDYIRSHNRRYDNNMEQGDGDDVAWEFRKLYYADEELRRKCKRSSFFGPAMIGEGPNGFLTPSK